MKNDLPDNFGRAIRLGLLAVLMTLGSILSLRAEVTVDESPSQASAASSTNAAASSTRTAWKDLDDDGGSDSHKHTHIEIHTDNALEADLIPIMGILATFGTPVLIVFFVCYFKYRRRRVNVMLAQEYLNKGLPVPPELLDESFGASGNNLAPSRSSSRCQSDLRRGFQLTFIGLGVTLALALTQSHATTWAWGLIPVIMGLGYLVSGWVESRQRGPDDPRNPPSPPRGTL